MKMKGRIEEGKNRTKEKKSLVGWRKKMPNTNEEGTNRKKKSNMEGINWKKKLYNGKVIKDKNDKTIVVLVKRRFSHPFFEKVITSSKKYHAHDENNKFKIGDIVKIIESRPYSKKKRWEVVNKWYRFKPN